jgi:hypothetical protein
MSSGMRRVELQEMRLQMAAMIEMVQWCRGDAAMQRSCGGGAARKRESEEQL